MDSSISAMIAGCASIGFGALVAWHLLTKYLPQRDERERQKDERHANEIAGIHKAHKKEMVDVWDKCERRVESERENGRMLLTFITERFMKGLERQEALLRELASDRGHDAVQDDGNGSAGL